MTGIVPARQCRFVIEVEWPGHRVVLRRSVCKRRTTDPSGLCWQHRPTCHTEDQ